MDIDLEIRKLPLAEKSELIRFLEENDSWRKLMKFIPELLSPEPKCDITPANPAKYRSDAFHTIEYASNLTKRFCSEILLREWGTSGRIRPTLGHLKYLLEKAQLYHAADFITIKVLKQERSSRPQKGPAAPIVFNSEELEDSEIQRIEKLLDEIDYPSSAIRNINRLNSVDTNLNYSTNEVAKSVPKIIISESPEEEEKAPVFNVPLVVQNIKTENEISDMIKFSTNSLTNSDNVSKISLESNNLPNLSSLLSNESSDNLPAVIESFNDSSSGENRPNLSTLLSDSSSDNTPPISLSDLNLSGSSSGNFPALSHLLSNSEQTAPNSRSCPSPLPNLSLNTPLPHFTYVELQNATQNFDETPISEHGRFLGAGNFGKVYLAELINKKVAVKKLKLTNAEVVQVDDRITRQFTAEVEILSRYRHENLATLLGYSCDGMTYCLVYEFVPGGALTERIQKHEFLWSERFYIALGTARAIAYLHTAYETPVVHRDVKSANILLDNNNKPKLCDFGLVKSCLNQHTYAASTAQGTSAYMAPEGIRGDVSPKLDTYSFGVVLLELLTSQPPYDVKRENGSDLITYVEHYCQNGIAHLLDTSIGSWTTNGINFGEELYQIAVNCVQDKKSLRPTMTSVRTALSDLIAKSV